MARKRLHDLIVVLFAVVFAFASLGHRASMAMPALPDCHGAAALDGAGDREGAAAQQDSHDGHSPAPPTGTPIGCPLASLPPLPAAQAMTAPRTFSLAQYRSSETPWPRSAQLDRIDPPPRHRS
jgi:hypothetical protein